MQWLTAAGDGCGATCSSLAGGWGEKGSCWCAGSVTAAGDLQLQAGGPLALLISSACSLHPCHHLLHEAWRRAEMAPRPCSARAKKAATKTNRSQKHGCCLDMTVLTPHKLMLLRELLFSPCHRHSTPSS